MDIVKCCCCCCFGPKPDSDESDVQLPVVELPPPPSPPPTGDTNVVLVTNQPEEKEIDISASNVVPPQNAETEMDLMVVASSKPQPENEVDMTSSTTATNVTEEEETPPKVTLRVPHEATAGSTIDVEWSYNATEFSETDSTDMIAIYPSESTVRSNFTYTRHGTPAQLVLPTQPGLYTIAYVSGNDHRRRLGSTTIALLPPSVSLSAPDTAYVGATMDVQWVGPNEKSDAIAIYPLNSNVRSNYTYTSTPGTPVSLLLPTKPGSYQIHYMSGQDHTIYATIPIQLLPVEATLTVPTEASIGSTILVEWTGPNYPNDHIAIYDLNQRVRIHYVYTSTGNPVQLLMPTKAGMYDIKYVMGQDNSIVTSTPINVIAVEATISGPSEGSIGSVIEVPWTGPNENGDYISINKVGHPERFYYAYTSTGNPVNITLPTNPGSYELKYCMGQNNTVLVTSPITVIAVEATLAAPSEGSAGSTVDVSWTGPDNTGDYIGISKVDTKKAIHYTYTSNGNPVTVTLPSSPGSYELKYYMGQDDRVIAKSPFTVMEVQATLSGPTEGQAGSLIEVPWSGPDNSGDYIGISKVGVKESLHHAYTSSGNPANVTLPTKPGSYELKYYMGQDDSVLVKSPITVVAVQATLSGPAEGRAGSIIEIPWSGPDNSGDYIGISKAGTKESLHHAYTSYGNPASITLPTKPGSYELKYYMGQDDSVLVKTAINVLAVDATLSGPAEGRAGSTIEVPWSGPDNSGDYIGIGKVGVDESLQYAYTTNGNPAYLTLPTKAGLYELRYYMGQDNSVLTKAAITITAATATLSTAAASGKAGSTIEVEWSGPDDNGDYIGICPSGKNESLEYVYTSYGSPIHVTLPTKPGAYEIKYFVGQDSSVLVSVPITVTED